jgi:hypothetical protein
MERRTPVAATVPRENPADSRVFRLGRTMRFTAGLRRFNVTDGLSILSRRAVLFRAWARMI